MLYFPAIPAPSAAETKPKQMALIPQGSETILVAEDEEAVRKVIVRSLEKNGYKVLEAPDGMEALQRGWSFKEPIHLLVTDTVMPRVNGRELAEELRKSRPQIRTLFISGYPKEILSQKGILNPGIHLLQKPFSSEEMLREVRKVLDE